MAQQGRGEIASGSMKGAPPVVAVEAELGSAAVAVQRVRLDVACPIESTLHEKDVYRLDLCLDARSSESRLCFTDHWPPHRFEPPGKLFLLPPGQTAHVRSGPSRQNLLLCRLRASSVQQWLSSDWEWTRPRIEASLDVSSFGIKNLLMRLDSEARAPGFASEILTESIGVQLAVELERYFLGVASRPDSGGLSAWRLRLIDDRLHATDAPPTLAELASLCGLSLRQLARGFRASRGVSIGSYVTGLRLDTARRRLASGESVKSVAFAVGFASVSSFSFAFKKATGLPPREYQQNARRHG